MPGCERLDIVKTTPLARIVPGAAAALLAVAVLSGCSGPAATTGATRSNPPSATAPTPSTSGSASPSSTSPTPAPSGSPTPGAPTTCTAADLTGSIQDQEGGGAAGSVVVGLVLTNSSDSACLLQGTPGVSYVGHGNGTQLGAAAARSGMTSAPLITLQPGDSATALLRETHAENYADCTPVPADGLRVYPPGATDALFIPQKATACSNSTIVLLSVKAFQPE